MIVAPDLVAYAFGMIQEEEVVNGDDLSRVSRWNQQRMRRVHHVDASRQPFDRWPFEPMPEIVQHGHRHAPIDDRGSKLGAERGRRPVFPRTGKERQLVVVRGRVCLHELTDVLADTRARTKGRAVVDENPHLWFAGMIASAVFLQVIRVLCTLEG
jgi:hypothetical protein